MVGRAILLGILVILNLVLVFRLLWSDQGVFAFLELKARYNMLSTQLEDADKRNADLSREITRLKKDKRYQEKVIRERRNFLKKDEVLYIFTPPKRAKEGSGDS